MNIRRMAAGVLLVVAAACASAGTQQERRERPVTTLEVDNQALLDMTIYVVRGGQRVRVGTARGLSTTVLRIPPDMIFGATTLQFLADPIGGGRLPISEQITVSEGDEVVIRIPPR